MNRTMTLQQALTRLETIVDALNGAELDVEESLNKFKEGAELVKFCRTELKRAENEFKKLQSDLDASARDDSDEDEV